MDSQVAVEITKQGDVTVISFDGALLCDADGIEAAGDKIKEMTLTEHPKKVVVDFCGVKFFSSQVLGVLLELWRRVEGFQGKVVIIGINPQLYRVFKITNLDKLFDFFDDKKSAVESLGRQG